jgi:hypothetical protein
MALYSEILSISSIKPSKFNPALFQVRYCPVYYIVSVVVYYGDKSLYKRGVIYLIIKCTRTFNCPIFQAAWI